MRIVIPPAPGAPATSGLTLNLPTPQPAAPAAAGLYQTALTLIAMGRDQAAIQALQAATAQATGHAAAWRKLAELQQQAGDHPAARACLDAAASAPQQPDAPATPDTRTAEQFAQAEARLRDMLAQMPAPAQPAWLRTLLAQNPRAVAAMRLLGKQEIADNNLPTARRLLERALELAPGYTACRADLAGLLMAEHHYPAVLAHTARLVSEATANPVYRALHADALRATGRFPQAIALMEELSRQGQRRPAFRCVYAQALHFAGRTEEAAAIYRVCLQEAPGTGTAYWGLAELRGEYLTPADVPGLRAQLSLPDVDPFNRMMMLYALGQALERSGDYEASFAAYQEGAELHCAAAAASLKAHNPDVATELAERHRVTFPASILSPHRHIAAPAHPTPIFIVGMPRAGSTLIEQILASHSQVEPTMELPVIEQITRHLNNSGADQDAYPECVPDLSAGDLAALGTHYIEQAAAYRSTQKPYFIDKRPANWRDIGLIHLILPHAKIIDIRRAPMAACFAMFKQILPEDCGFSYNLSDLALFYKDYELLMQHWHQALPGRIHAQSYETLVENPEPQIRDLLKYCGLPFEEPCLRFWETSRAVATPSASQVRRPIFREAVEQWRHFSPWLGELREALGLNDS